ncbi:glutathione S-transferase family protein [Corallincola spongiicola]|uniref:Glutathione S-transferase family protein n=1 Tax=Corallincola spongiicola TaxID=2520508 RepID=A0ABY1WPC4_9GAMM|nr:glutathione S-transferase family protein [Corallincola spongiicola]
MVSLGLSLPSDVQVVTQTDSLPTLYSFARFDRSARVRWLLYELGVPYHEVVLDHAKGEHQQPHFVARNPFALVPVWEDGELVLHESGAIILHLLANTPAHELLPNDKLGRSRCMSYLMFGLSTLDAAVSQVFVTKNQAGTAVVKLKRLLQALDTELVGQDYLVGHSFTVADIVVGQLLGLLDRRDQLAGFDNLEYYLTRLKQRSAAAKAEVFTADVNA